MNCTLVEEEKRWRQTGKTKAVQHIEQKLRCIRRSIRDNCTLHKLMWFLCTFYEVLTIFSPFSDDFFFLLLRISHNNSYLAVLHMVFDLNIIAVTLGIIKKENFISRGKAAIQLHQMKYSREKRKNLKSSSPFLDFKQTQLQLNYRFDIMSKCELYARTTSRAERCTKRTKNEIDQPQRTGNV